MTTQSLTGAYNPSNTSRAGFAQKVRRIERLQYTSAFVANFFNQSIPNRGCLDFSLGCLNMFDLYLVDNSSEIRAIRFNLTTSAE